MICIVIVCCLFFFFFFKQKTAYEMRISDWSSDVCSSDLVVLAPKAEATSSYLVGCTTHSKLFAWGRDLLSSQILPTLRWLISAQIGRASCRERVCQYV